MKKQQVCQKSISEFNQNKRHEFGSRKLMILVSPAPSETKGQNVVLGGNLEKKNNESALGGKTMNLHKKTEDGTLKCENQ